MINLEAYKSDKKEFVMDDYGHIRPANINQSELAKEAISNRTVFDVTRDNDLGLNNISSIKKEAEHFRDSVASVIGYKKKFSWEK